MEKNKIVGAFCASVMFIIVSIGYFGKNTVVSEQAFLDNIEALSGGEDGGDIVRCYCKSHWFSPNVCSVNADGGYCGGDPCDSHDGNCR